jgi:hypothetical protein
MLSVGKGQIVFDVNIFLVYIIGSPNLLHFLQNLYFYTYYTGGYLKPDVFYGRRSFIIVFFCHWVLY